MTLRTSSRLLKVLFLGSLTSSAASCQFSTTQLQFCSNSNSMLPNVEAAKKAAVWGMFISDSVAMPVHWFYNPNDIKRYYGNWLYGYTAPTDKHPTSILNLSSTGGSGRSGMKRESKQIIGDVILHDKVKFWKSGSSVHYHRGMSAGDNTLNALTALETFKVMQKEDPDHTLNLHSLQAKVMENYVKFMTTPGTHNDTYAESFHRSFFKDWSDMDNPPHKGEDLVDMAEKRFKKVSKHSEDHQLAVIGSLVIVLPWVIHYSHKPREECINAAVSSLRLTHPAPSLTPYVEAYAGLLHAVINGKSLHDEIVTMLTNGGVIGSRKGEIIQEIAEEASKYADTESRLKLYQEGTGMLGSACYIDGAMSSMLLLALGFHNDFSGGILTNANCGGENVHRGAALGALLGANTQSTKKEIVSSWKDGLNSAKERIIETTSHNI